MTTASAKNSENILFFIVFFSSNSVDYFGRTMRPISLDLIVALPILIYKNIILLFEQIPVICLFLQLLRRFLSLKKIHSRKTKTDLGKILLPKSVYKFYCVLSV